jgi:hypothetical protein
MKTCMKILTDDNIGPASRLLNKRRRVKIAEHDAHIGICLGDGGGFGTISHESTDVVVWMSSLESVEHVPADEA